MKFGQFVEYNMKKKILENPFTKCGRETSFSPFLKNKIEHVYRSAISYMLLVLLKLRTTNVKLISLDRILHDLSRKIFLPQYFINWPNFVALLLFCFEMSDTTFIVLACDRVSKVIVFGICL